MTELLMTERIYLGRPKIAQGWAIFTDAAHPDTETHGLGSAHGPKYA